MDHRTPLPRLGALRTVGEHVDRFDIDRVTVRRSPRLAGLLDATTIDEAQLPVPVRVAQRTDTDR